MQLIEPTDAEQAIIDTLAGPVGSSLPETMPATFIRVVSLGGTPRDIVTDTPLVTLEAFAKTGTTAVALLNRAIATIQATVRETGKLGNETCYGVQVNSLPQNFPLPSVPTHRRYIATISPALRRRVTTL